MRKSTKYFINQARVQNSNLILYYYFDKNNFDENDYIFNDSEYISYTGKYDGDTDINEALDLKSGSLYFDGDSKLDINLNNFVTNEFTLVLCYEKETSGNGVLFSSIKTGSSGQYYGFNIGVNDYNNLLIEYYDTSGELRYISTRNRLDTKGSIIIKGFNQNLDILYYNAAQDNLALENFSILKDRNISTTGSFTLGSGNYSYLNNYKGYISDFVFMNKNLVESEANNLLDLFFYDLTSGYSFNRTSETYSYLRFPSNISAIFDNYIDLTGSFLKFGDDFLEAPSTISGSITGSNYSLDLTGVTGYVIGFTESWTELNKIQDNIKKIEFFDYVGDQTNLILLNNGKITGFGDNEWGKLFGTVWYDYEPTAPWSGSPVGRLTNVIDLKCKNRGCLALFSNGTVTGWGYNEYGRIFGTTGFNDASNVFTGNFNNSPLANLSSIKSIELGNNHALFLTSGSGLLSWGYNNEGQVAGVNDRNTFPLKLSINNIYPNLSFYSGLFLHYTGMIENRPSYKLIDDPVGHGIDLHYDAATGFWKFNYLSGQRYVLLKDKNSMPFENKLLPSTVNIDGSNETGLNGIYILDTDSFKKTDITGFTAGGLWIMPNNLGLSTGVYLEKNSDITLRIDGGWGGYPLVWERSIDGFSWSSFSLIKTHYYSGNMDNVNSSTTFLTNNLYPQQSPYLNVALTSTPSHTSSVNHNNPNTNARGIYTGNLGNYNYIRVNSFDGGGGNYAVNLKSQIFDPIYYHQNYNTPLALDNFNQPIINYFKIKRNSNSNNRWSVYNGSSVIAYNNENNLIDEIPPTGWSPITQNGYLGTLELTRIYIDFNYEYNSSLEGIFTGIWNETNTSKITGVKKISVGDDFNIALLQDSGIKIWGDNSDGQLNGNILNTSVIDIASGPKHGIAILDINKSLTGWGDDTNGQAGDLIGLTGAKSIDATIGSTQVLFENENLLGYGFNAFSPNLQTGRIYNASENGVFVKYVTGTQDLNLVSGNAYFNFNIAPERPIFVTENITQVITGYELRPTFTGVTGYSTGFLKDIPDYYYTGFPLYTITGYTGVLSGLVITGTQTGIIGTIQKLSLVPYQVSFSSGIYDAQKTGNYIYSFYYASNITNIRGTESVFLDSGALSSTSKEMFDSNKAYNVTKISAINYSKTYQRSKKINYLNEMGVENILINTKLENFDIIEIYQFKINNEFDINIRTPVELIRTSNSFRVNSTGTNYLIESNGIGQALNLDYTATGTLISHFGNYDFSDIIEANFIRLDQNIIDYTGQSTESLIPKDFVYLNGIKLISGYHYNFNNNNNNNISFITNNIPVTGIIQTAKSLIPYVSYTGNQYYYNSDNRFSKNTTMVWINGIRMNKDSYYELSDNDIYMTPDFYDKKSVIIYNNTDNFINL